MTHPICRHVFASAIFFSQSLSFISMSLADDDSLSSALKVPATIHSVHSGGFWEQGGQEGFYRAIVVSGGVEVVSHNLVLQWLAIDPSSGGYVLKWSKSALDKRSSRGRVISIETEFGDINAFRVSVTVDSQSGGAEKHIISLGAGGNFSVK